MTALLAARSEPAGFADDPVASHSAQFGLGRPMGTPAGHDAPSLLAFARGICGAPR
ncbi:MAG: hypothetical protein M3460_03250 [Actinomycetota bacterium]|nr:hypothetical protein [Actinomycetota bacterium]